MQVCTPSKTTMPTSHHSVFFTGRMPFLTPNQQRQSTEGKPYALVPELSVTFVLHIVHLLACSILPCLAYVISMAKFGLHITGFVLVQHDNCYYSGRGLPWALVWTEVFCRMQLIFYGCEVVKDNRGFALSPDPSSGLSCCMLFTIFSLLPFSYPLSYHCKCGAAYSALLLMMQCNCFSLINWFSL